MKKIIVSTLALSVIALMSGCGGGGDSAGSDPANGGSTVTAYTVGGTLTGLATGASVALLNNGGDTLVVTADGSFTFNRTLADNASYIVSIQAQPISPYQTCSLSGESGTVGGANVQSVTVNCVTNNFTVSGFVTGTGLNGSGNSVTLQNNVGDDVTLTANGGFSFPVAPSGSSYSVSVLAQTTFPSQTCTVTGGNGILEGIDVTVYVECIRESFTVSGTLTALAVGTSVTLQNNAGDNLVLSADGNFSFSTAIEDGGAYNVIVLTQPVSPVQNCAVSNASGTFSSNNVNDVLVVCLTDTFVNGFVDSGQLLAQKINAGVGTKEVTKGVALGDIDGDNDLDIVAVGRIGQDSEIYSNDGSGVFTSTQSLNETLSVTRTSSSVVLADVDGDSDLDMILGITGVEGSMIYTNDGAGVFSDSGQALGVNFDTADIFVGDVDGDSDLDIVQANKINGGSTGSTIPNRVYLNNGAGVFTDSGQALGAASTVAIALGDLNGDGDLDMVTGNQSSANQVYFNNGTGTFTNSANPVGASESGGTTSSVALGDLDGDGDLDLITGRLGGTSRIYFNQNNSGLFAESTQDLGFGATTSVIIADVDGDSDLDFILGNQNNLSSIYINDGTGTFIEHVTSSELGSLDLQAMAIGDVDGDSDLDLVTGNGAANTFDLGKDRVFLNQTN